MKELEFYLKDGINTGQKICSIAYCIKNRKTDCEDESCAECEFYSNRDKILKNLLKEHRIIPNLTYSEKVIIDKLEDGWLTRDENDSLCWHEYKPVKNQQDGYWNNKGKSGYLPFKNILSFISWEDEEPWSIKELLHG